MSRLVGLVQRVTKKFARFWFQDFSTEFNIFYKFEKIVFDFFLITWEFLTSNGNLATKTYLKFVICFNTKF